jgi:hypothetical protein
MFMYYDYARLLLASADSMYKRHVAGALFALAVHFKEDPALAEVEEWKEYRDTATDVTASLRVVEEMAAEEVNNTRFLFATASRLRRRYGRREGAAESSYLREPLLRAVWPVLKLDEPFDEGDRERDYQRFVVGQALVVTYLLDLRNFGTASMSDGERLAFDMVLGHSPMTFGIEVARAAEMIWWNAQGERFEKRADG